MMIKQGVLACSLVAVMSVGIAQSAAAEQHYYICHQYQPMSHLPFPCFQCSATKKYAIQKASFSYVNKQHPYYACKDYKGDYNYHWFFSRAQADKWRWRHCHCG